MKMAGFRASVVGASVMGLAAALLLGAAVHVISPLIDIGSIIASVDAYTEKGGYGLGNVSSSFLSNESVSIFAQLKDSTSKPVVDASVKFEIHGPLGSNIKLTRSATTNRSGVAVATVTSEDFDGQEIALGVWTTTATAEANDPPIFDSLTFEVKLAPSPFVDVFADRGGNGANTQSQPYRRNETVTLYALVSNGTNPVEGLQVTFAVYAPSNFTGLVSISQSNSSGLAEATFRIPPVVESIGTWRIITTVRVFDKVFVDAMTFECIAEPQ